MRRPLLLLALCAASLAAARVSAEEKMDAKTHRMKKAVVLDRHGFEKPIPALTLLVPSDWNFEGEALWPRGGAPCGDLVNLQFRATSPDGKTAFELHPAYSWQWADAPQMRQMMMGQNQQNAQWGKPACEVMPTMNAADFLLKVAVPKLRPNAKVLGHEPIPGAREQLQKNVQQQQMQANQVGLRMKFTVDDARVKLSYSGPQGQIEEWMTAVVSVTAMPMPTLDPRSGQMMQSASYNESARFLFQMRAPQGQLEENEKLFELIASTIRLDPDWSARIAQVQGNINATNQKGIADRAAIQRKSAEDTARIRNETWQNQERAQDEQHAQFSQYLRGVETYKDPNTGEKVELDSRYGHAWSNGAGEYILSESPGYNPNANQNGNWTELERSKP